MSTIKQTFFQECEEQLAELEAGLLAMDEGEADSETVNAVFRAVHSIKGGAGAFKLADLVQFAHIFETTLDKVREGKLEASPAVMKTMLRAADVLADLVHAARDGVDLPEDRWQPLAGELDALSAAAPGDEAGDEDEPVEFDFQPLAIFVAEDDGAPAADEGPRTFSIRFKPKPELYAAANDPVLILRELSRLGEATVRCDAGEVPLLDALDPSGSYLGWTVELVTDQHEGAVREVFEFVESDCELDIALVAAPPSPEDDPTGPTGPTDGAAAAVVSFPAPPGDGDARPSGDDPAASQPPPPARSEPQGNAATAAPSEPQGNAASAAKADAAKAESGAAPATIRVDLDRVDRLINQVGELVINRAMLSQRITEAGLTSSVATGLTELEQLTREIQESVMAIRAQPVKPLFQRMSRIVRECASSTGKSVRLRTEGEATEVDKTVIERLADPLTHMIRNAVDHGLESTEDRLAAGKPEEGVVRLTAAHRSGRIVIEIADDGAGIDRPRVREIAVRKGLIADEAQLSETEIDNLLFMPGFSTASTVSNLSGRGVGMDVVKRSIQALGGRISITSRRGAGTTFTMSLPLTLAVLDGMVVSVNGHTVIVPLTAIVETLQPRPADVHGLGIGSRVIAIRDSFIPLIDVALELGYRHDAADALSGVAMLVEGEDGARHALLVDRILDQRQVVIKSLEGNYGQVDGIAAATILGDGRVALILDVDAIVHRSRDSVGLADSLFAANG
jgi:two-component system chemotaxis sensor kinase CheA